MQPSPSYTTPLAIIVGFALIAIAIYLTGSGSTTTNSGTPTPSATTATVRAVDATDYIRGNPNAPIVLIEYSDYECPFCQVFHQTMIQILNEYGLSGKVAWVYRQMPLTELHPNASRVAEAALCAGDIGGNDAFWKFSDAIFENREVNQFTNISQLGVFATAAGINTDTFDNCLSSGRMKERVATSVAEGQALGIEGTPHTILIVGDQQAIIEGARPYAEVRGIVDNLVQQLQGIPVSTATPTTP